MEIKATSNIPALSSFRVVKHVTRPLLKLVDDVPAYVQIESVFRQAEQQKNPKMVVQADGSKVPQPPPYIIDVLNLTDGVSSQMVANEVFRTELEKQYKDGAFVGRYFEIIKRTKAEGKNYNTFGITELAPVEEKKEEAPAATGQNAPSEPSKISKK